MVYLVHGTDNLSSRNYFYSKKDKDSLFFDAQNLNLVELSQALDESSLFKSSKKIFIDNLFTKKGNKNLNDVINILEKDNNIDVYIWSDKDIKINIFSKIENIENRNFKIPQTIWTFLDGIKPNNTNNLISFHKALSGTEVEIVFTMIVRQFRLLIGVSSETSSSIDEIKRLAPWQKSKLTKQASFFDLKSFKKIYKKLYEIEKGNKTGRSNLNLTQNIDILLLEI